MKIPYTFPAIPAQTVMIDVPDPIIIPIPVPTPIPTPEPTPTPVPTPIPPVGRRLYSATSFWNKRLSNEPIHQNSEGFIAELVAQSTNPPADWPTINIDKYTRPVFFVDTDIPRTKVYLPKKSGSPNDIELQKGIRIPQNVMASGGDDGHLCIVDLVDGTEYDFWQFKFSNSLNRWESSDAGIIHDVMNSNGINPIQNGHWNSATATHLPLGGGLPMWEELKAGYISHGLALAIARPSSNFVWPAQSGDGWYIGKNAIPEGTRFRFPANIIINPVWCPLIKMLVIASRDYGITIVDKSTCLTFCIEDGKQYAPLGVVNKAAWAYGEIKRLYMNDNHTYQIISQFPWSKLQVLA